MSSNKLRFVKLHTDAILPTKAHQSDAGFDLYTVESGVIFYNDRKLFRTGLSVEIPEGYAGFVQPRSGLASKRGVTVLNTPGLIDSGFRGELKVLLYNSNSKGTDFVAKGDRIAQLVIIKVPEFEPELVEVLEESDRSEKGFGSTGN